MGPGREAQSVGGVLCGIPRDFRSPPLASESTETDENNPDPHRNSVSPHPYFPLETAMAAPLKRRLHSAVRGKPAASGFESHEFSNHSWSSCEERRDDLREYGSKGNNSTSQPTQQRTQCSASRALGDRLSAHRTGDPYSSGSSSHVVSECSPASMRATEAESDDGVAVYIDEVEDDDTSEALLITEYRISARKAAEIRAFKSKWVEQMLLGRDRLLGVSFGKVAVKDRSSRNRATTRPPGDAAATVGCGLEFLQRKLEAFAACMTPEALECIQRNSQSWGEYDSAESDATASAIGSPRSTRCGLSKDSSESSLSINRGLHSPAKPCLARLIPKLHLRSRDRDGKLRVGPVTVALQAWGRFLKYVRKTCKVLPPRPRLDRLAGLESDDDDEQAPLYMCRPGSVQRPSPLISHSLMEHLKASNTLFFNQFRRPLTTAPPSFQARGVAAAGAAAQDQPTHALASDPAAAPAAAHSSSAGDSSFSLARGAGCCAHAKGRASEMATQDAIPLFEVTTEASAMFGDLMRLDDTARMLEASCTFRLAAAPCSKICNKNWQPRSSARARARSESTRTQKGDGACSPEPVAPALALDFPNRGGDGCGTVCTSPSAPETLSQRIAGKPASAHSRGVSAQQVAGGSQGQHGERSPSVVASVQPEGSRVVYTVQADDDTLALSGLDPDYCARVAFASQGAHRAMESLAHMELLQPNGNLPQEQLPAPSAAQKKRRKTPVEDNELSSGDDDSASDCTALDEAGSGTASRLEAAEEPDHDRSLMADKLLLAHLMPYLPQFGPQ